MWRCSVIGKRGRCCITRVFSSHSGTWRGRRIVSETGREIEKESDREIGEKEVDQRTETENEDIGVEAEREREGAEVGE